MGDAREGLSTLPPELLLIIFSFLRAGDLGSLCLVSRFFNQLSEHDSVWVSAWERHYPHKPMTQMEEKAKKVFKDQVLILERWKATPRIIYHNIHSSFTRALQFDEAKCISCTDSNDMEEICYWDINELINPETKEPKAVARELVHEVLALQFDNEKDLFIHTTDHDIQVRKVAPVHSGIGPIQRTLQGHTQIVWTLQFHGNSLVSGGRDEDIREWDIETGACLNVLMRHTSDVRYLRCNEQMIVSHGDDHSVIVWDRRTGNPVQTLITNSDFGWGCQFDDDKIMCNGRDNEGFQIWDMRTFEKRAVLPIRINPGSPGFIYFDEKRIIGGSGEVKIWGAHDLQPVNTIPIAAGGSIVHFQCDDDKMLAGLDYTSSSSLMILDFMPDRKFS